MMTTNPNASPTATPRAVAARFPDEYGQTDESRAELQAWPDVAVRIAAAKNYWLATVAGDGRPHLRAIDGVFVDDTLAFGGSPATRWVRHLERRPSVSISLPDDDHAVILEGDAELITDPALAIAAAVAAANAVKYPQYQGQGGPELQPFWAVRPRRVYAWSLTGFPARATRFDFDTAGSR